MATQAPALHIGVAESVQSADAEHVDTTAAVASMGPVCMTIVFVQERQRLHLFVGAVSLWTRPPALHLCAGPQKLIPSAQHQDDELLHMTKATTVQPWEHDSLLHDGTCGYLSRPAQQGRRSPC